MKLRPVVIGVIVGLAMHLYLFGLDLFEAAQPHLFLVFIRLVPFVSVAATLALAAAAVVLVPQEAYE